MIVFHHLFRKDLLIVPAVFLESGNGTEDTAGINTPIIATRFDNVINVDMDCFEDLCSLSALSPTPAVISMDRTSRLTCLH